ncbi:MAG: MBL fold metallo-hydrolase [bacterium]
MEIEFIGAAQTVTGSMHLVRTNGYTFLLDSGLYQGKRKEAFELNRTFDLFDPEEIDFIILSHAHIDHAGNLPSLVKRGFKGNIYATFATLDLCSVMLLDSAHIQVKDTEFVNKKRKKHGQNLFEPLYVEEDVHQTMRQFVGVNYHREFVINEGIKVTFFDAGHILGSSLVFLSINENGRLINFGFSGDLGRKNMPILKDPEKIPDIEYFICESTYGGRFHDTPHNSENRLAEIINKAHARNGKIIIPAFSVGRTQELVFSINKIFESKKAAKLPVYVDSPLSVNATNIFRKHQECFDTEISQFMLKSEDPFGFNELHYISDVSDSKRLNESRQPCIIISSSGMCEAGRILHHLSNNIENPNNIILMVGYAAAETLGRRLIEGSKLVKIFGDERQVNAEIIVMNSFSAHADSNELIEYVNQFDKSRLQNIFLVHGDRDQQDKYKTRLNDIGFKKVTIPARGDVFTL